LIKIEDYYGYTFYVNYPGKMWEFECSDNFLFLVNLSVNY